MGLIKWLKPGLKIKRWILLGVLGLLLFSFGISGVFYGINISQGNYSLKAVVMMIGLCIIGISIRNGFNSLLSVLPHFRNNTDLVNKESFNKMLYKERILIKGPKIVVIGGGTGLSILLRGLKEFTSNITAIVTVADDGGGSGILREDLGMLPPGDIRSCILSLANTEPQMEKLLQYRFREGKLKGQSFGNLFIAAMNEIHGNFETAIKEMSNVLAVTGRVLPMTLEDVKLYAKLENGEIIEGESNIPIKNMEIGSKIEEVFISPIDSKPLKEAVDAIKEADGIVLGPGSLYTSVIPNLLVKDICELIEKSKALKIYVPNIMTQPGETDGYNVLDHVNTINRYGKGKIINYIVTNVEKIPRETLKKYSDKDGAEPVELSRNQEDILEKNNIKIIKANLIDIKRNYIRHDAVRLSQIVADLVINEKIKKEKYSFETRRNKINI